MEAVASVRLLDGTFDPTIHTAMVWCGNSSWPPAASPTTYLPPIPMPSGSTLVWSQRESLDVPLAMQSTDLASNPKYLAISRHASQGNFIFGFLHKDEIFWTE
jgi:hypothetical protein